MATTPPPASTSQLTSTVTTWTTRLYVAGAVILLAGFLYGVFSHWSQASTVVLFLGYACMGAGLLVWLVPVLRRASKHVLVRRLLLLGHVAVLIVAAIAARNVMTSATGLPGQDFTMAVSALSLLLYPLVWLWVTVAMASVGMVIWVLCIFGQAVLHSMLTSAAPVIGEGPAERMQGGLFRRFAHLLGAVFVMIGLAAVDSHLQGYRPSVEALGRWVAYYGDYQQVTRFPGIEPGRRVLMHANGVYSEATVQPGFSVQITVGVLPTAQ